MAIRKIRIGECPFCGGTEFTEGVQDLHGQVMCKKRNGSSMALYHVFCTACGSAVRSYVYRPRELDPYPSED